MDKLSHFTPEGASRMVDVSDKPTTARMARATGQVRMRPETLRLVRDRQMSKGDVLEVARLAGIMAAKETSRLVPLCHTVPLESVEIGFSFPTGDTLAIEATTRATARTGVEMEALVAVSVTALTVYDMCKGVDRGMTLGSFQLEEKLGGRSGHFVRGQAGEPA